MKRRLLIFTLVTGAALHAACGEDPNRGGRADGGSVEDAGAGGGAGGGGGSFIGCVPGCPAPRVCKVSTNTCVECVSDSDCGARVCDVLKNVCRDVPDAGADAGVDDAGMGGGTGGGTGGGSGSDAGAPPNDTCSAPTAISLSPSSTMTVTADNTGARDDYDGTCRPTPTNNEIVYEVTVPPGNQLTLSLGGAAGSGVDAIVYAREGSCTPGTELGCRDVETDGADVLVIPPSQTARTLWVFAESYDGLDGPMTLTFTTAPPPPPTGETCGEALPADISSGVATFAIDLGNATNDYASGDCGGAGPDQFRTFTVPRPSDIDIYVFPNLAQDGGTLDGGPTHDVVALLLDGCPSSELACADVGFGSQGELISLRNAAAGTYVAGADGFTPGRGPVTLKIVVQDAGTVPPNYDCSRALPFTTSITGDTNRSYHWAYYSCGGLGAVDLSYEYTPTMSGTLTVTAQGMNGFRPIVTIAEDCMTFADLGCGVADATGLATAAAPVTSGVPVKIFVDGQPGETGQFTLTATVQ